MTPACPEWDDSPWIADEDKVEVETDEGSGEGVVGEVVRREVVEREDCDEDEDVVGGSADAEVGAAMVEVVMTDPEVVRIVGGTEGKLDDDGSGEEEPPKTQTLSEPRGI